LFLYFCLPGITARNYPVVRLEVKSVFVFIEPPDLAQTNGLMQS